MGDVLGLLLLCLTVHSGRIASETAEQIWLKFCTEGRRFVPDIASRILVAIAPWVPSRAHGAPPGPIGPHQGHGSSPGLMGPPGKLKMYCGETLCQSGTERLG